MEPDSGDGSPQEDESQEMDQRVRIKIHSRRRRLADPDGISCKACLDGLVQGGLLKDDSAKYISDVSFTQEKANIEETIVEVIFDEE